MREYAIYCYAWDLADHGVAEAVGDFQALGLNAVTLAASYHAGKFLRPHGESGKVYFPEDGTIYFRADASRYGEIKPVANSILESRDVLADLCDRSDVATNAWLVLMHNSRLGAAYPHATVANAFGDHFAYSLCPAAPAAREYAAALCDDVTRSYGLRAIALETPGYLPYVHGYHHEFGLVRQNPWLNNLLGLCFCDHCRTGARDAAIDADALQGRVRTWIETYLASDVDFPDTMAEAFWTADVLLDPDLGAFLRWRCTVVTSLIEEIRRSVRPEVSVSVIPSVARPTAGAWYEGSDLSAFAAAADAVAVCFYEPDIGRIRSDLLDVRRRIGTAGKIHGILRPGYPDLTSREAVAGAVEALVSGGIDHVAFYNYGHLRQSSLDWMGQAIAAVESAS